MSDTASPIASLRGVSKSFGGRPILADVSLDLSSGQIVAVVGPSGGGKSVLLELLLGLIKPDAGQVRTPPDTGMVFQDSALFDDLSVHENLAFPAQIRGLRAEEAVSAAAAAVGLLPGHLAARPAQLSGGLRKRAAIARALVQAPSVLLYDEPTAGLDASAGLQVGRAILAAREAQPLQAALVVTHDYLLAANIADQIWFLDPQSHGLKLLFQRPPQAPSSLELRAALEEHFARVEPPPSEPGQARAPWRFKAALAAALSTVALLKGVSWPSVRALGQRLVDVGLTSLPSVAASGLVLGLVTALQIGQALGLSLGDLDPLPSLLGVVLFHHVGPLYTGLFLAGRVGARIASEVGIKTYLRQADALLTFGTTAERVWLSPLLWAGLLAFPVLTLVLELCGVAGGYVGYVALLGENSAGFTHTALADVELGATAFGLLKAQVTGAAVVLLAYASGRGARRGSDAVGRATTRAVVAGLLGVIGVELFFSLLGGL